MNLRRLGYLLCEFLWPRFCPVCRKRTDRPSGVVCSHCLMRLPFVEQHEGCCRVCGRPVEEVKTDFLCEDCKIHKPRFDRAATALYYTGIARAMVQNYKYNGHVWLAEDFGSFLEAAAYARFDVEAIDCVLPMPVTVLHRILRGYNQSSYLAKQVARRLQKPYLKGVLVRRGHSKRQAGLSEEERRKNVKDTFTVRRASGIQGRTLLLVDDVLTTGSTLSEAADVLKKAGARQVLALTLARSFKN